MAPLWFVWLCEFCRIFFCGSDYFMIRRFNLEQSLFVAGVVWKACRDIRSKQAADGRP